MIDLIDLVKIIVGYTTLVIVWFVSGYIGVLAMMAGFLFIALQ